jgi:hypothetical protein
VGSAGKGKGKPLPGSPAELASPGGARHKCRYDPPDDEAYADDYDDTTESSSGDGQGLFGVDAEEEEEEEGAGGASWWQASAPWAAHGAPVLSSE